MSYCVSLNRKSFMWNLTKLDKTETQWEIFLARKKKKKMKSFANSTFARNNFLKKKGLFTFSLLFFVPPPSFYPIWNNQKRVNSWGTLLHIDKNWKLVELFFSFEFQIKYGGTPPCSWKYWIFKSKWCFGGKVRYTIKVKFSLEKSLQGTLGCCSAELYVPLNSTLKIIKT